MATSLNSSELIERHLKALPPIEFDPSTPPLDEISARQISEMLRVANPGLYDTIRENIGRWVYDIETSEAHAKTIKNENIIPLTPMQMRGIIALATLTGAAIACAVVGKSLDEATALERPVVNDGERAA